MNRTATAILAALVTAGSLAALSIAEPTTGMPDPALTPGAVATTDVREVCASDGLPGSSYSRKHRNTTAEMKAEVRRRYGITGHFRGEIDHRVPLCLGGADTLENLWPQTDFRGKDELEASMCRAVCRGHISLGAAQAIFLSDWRGSLR